ncbi:MAG: hypothetical protein JJT89_04525 [Nitriliruptoraceae bacterium]|nr:hypothetical protein [Nitriliruptoraceae bacterium]
MSDRPDELPGDAAEPSGTTPPVPPIVDFSATGRRVRRFLGIILGTVLVAWTVRGLVDGAFEVRLLAELLGVGILLTFAVELVVVGGAALRGMLQAGERGDRLAAEDVALLPPQLRRRRRRD